MGRANLRVMPICDISNILQTINVNGQVTASQNQYNQLYLTILLDNKNEMYDILTVNNNKELIEIAPKSNKINWTASHRIVMPLQLHYMHLSCPPPN